MRHACHLVVVAILLLTAGYSNLSAHPGSVALWHVTFEGPQVRSRIVVPLTDVGGRRTPDDPHEASLAVARDLLAHFAVIVDGQRAWADVERVTVHPSGSFEVVGQHLVPRDARKLALRSTFHELTDDSHRVIARLDQHGSTAQLLFTSATPEHVLPEVGLWESFAPPGSVRGMLVLGIEHIVTGWDHLVFLLCLLVPGGTLRSRVVMVTAFTVAHSLTLLLAATHVVVPPERFVEAAIAVTVAYVAIENLVRDGPRSRWPIAFGFGLIHGFGFAGMLDVLDLPMGQFATSVIAFNVGVEIGQLAVVALAVPLIARSARHRWHRTFVQSSSIAVCGLAAFWLVERLS